MAYTLFKRAPRCLYCRQRGRPLYTFHSATGACIGILCAPCGGGWLLCDGVTAAPLGNMHAPSRHRRRRFSPARG